MNKNKSAPQITLNENELFENFLEVNGHCFPLLGCREFTVKVRDLFSWYYDELDGLQDAIERLADECVDEGFRLDPGNAVEEAAQALETAADHLRLISRTFAEFKRQHLIESEDDDPEESDRYRVPQLHDLPNNLAKFAGIFGCTSPNEIANKLAEMRNAILKATGNDPMLVPSVTDMRRDIERQLRG